MRASYNEVYNVMRLYAAHCNTVADNDLHTSVICTVKLYSRIRQYNGTVSVTSHQMETLITTCLYYQYILTLHHPSIE